MNLPNSLTLSRIFVVPLLVVVLLTPFSEDWFGLQRHILGVTIFLAAAFTDYLDGKIARRRQQVSRLGQLLDPIADKLLISAALISLVENRLAPAWAVCIIIGRELAVTGLRSVAAEQGVVIAASWLGKGKTILQVAAVFALIAVESSPLWVDLLVYAAVAMTLVSGADYFFGLRRTLERRRAPAAGSRGVPAE